MIGDLGVRDATELAGMVARGDVSPTELLDAALAAVEARNPALNAVVLMQEGVARRAIAGGLPRGPFRGVPFLLKDLGCEAVDFPSHNGSRLFADTRYDRDSAIFQRIRATGVVTFGRTTSPEGGVGAVTEAQVYGGPTRSPWNPGHTPGGSSGGSLSPNPFNESLFIRTTEQTQGTIHVFNVQGILVHKEDKFLGSRTIPTGNWAPGI